MAQKTNNSLNKAQKAKNDEFYTQYYEIEKEINAYLEYDPNTFKDKTVLLPCDDPEWSNFTIFFAQNFENFGLKKLISTSYAIESKQYEIDYNPTEFEENNPNFDVDKNKVKGKIFTLTEDINKDGKINFHDLEWEYLKGDGDFRSDEVKKLRDEADIIITNPPFSLFREFLAWIIEGNKQFTIIGNMNAITYKEVFPLIRDNQLWLGAGNNDGRNIWYQVPNNYETFHKEENGNKYAFVAGTVWFTNIEHGRRHSSLSLMSMADNKKFNKKVIKSDKIYKKYDNYDAIEVSFVDAIPSDYKGIMGVPISFLNKYCPEQFELLGSNRGVDQDKNKIYGRSSILGGKETFKCSD